MNEEEKINEEFRTSGDEIIARMKKLIREGNLRHFVLKNKSGNTLLKIRVTWGIFLTLIFPGVVVILGLIAVLLRCVFVIEVKDTM